MTEILDRIGRLVYPAAYLIEADPRALARAREVARKVLEAIREPSEEMIDAGVGYDEWFERSDARGVWQAMIDAAA